MSFSVQKTPSIGIFSKRDYNNNLTLGAQTTAPNQTVTIDVLKPVGKSIKVHWGDSTTPTTVASGSTSPVTHQYASAGSYRILVEQINVVSNIELYDPKIKRFKTREICKNDINTIYLSSISGSSVCSKDMRSWTPTNFGIDSMTATIDSADISSWRPTTWYMFYMNSGSYRINSLDLSAWNPTTLFELDNMIDGDYTFDSADVTDWRPTSFYLYALPGNGFRFDFEDVVNWNPSYIDIDGIDGNFYLDTADISSWRPSGFWFYNLPGTFSISTANITNWRPLVFIVGDFSSGTYTIRSSDIVDWRPRVFVVYGLPSGTYNINSETTPLWNLQNGAYQVYDMPSGTYNFNFSNASAWKITTFSFYNLPGGTVTISPANISGWTPTNNFYIQDMGLSQAQVDAILNGLWQAFPSKQYSGGNLNVSGTNSTPSGTYQADTTPEDGKEFAYELKNDSGNVNPTKKWSTVTYTL